MKKIAVVGLGYVGLPLAHALSSQHLVFGYDTNRQRISDLNAGIDCTNELSAEKLNQAIKNEAVFTSDVSAIADCSVYIVTVPTPIDSKNQPDLRPLESASRTIAKLLTKGDTAVYESTVYPGCTEEVCVPILEQLSGLTYNQDFFCGYSPERINPGDTKNSLQNVKKVISASNDTTLMLLEEIYGGIIKAGLHKAPSMQVAEAAKVIENAQRDVNIAFINELSQIFNKLGLDTLEVLKAAESKWNFLPFKPGLVGGHCIGVDPYYLLHKAETIQVKSNVIKAARLINDAMASYCSKQILKLLLDENIALKNSRVAILGVTFKENCPDIRNSKIFEIIHLLKQQGVEVVLSDPIADSQLVHRESGEHLVKFAKLEQMANFDAVIVAVGHSLFRDMSLKQVIKLCKNPKRPIVADLKGLYPLALLQELNVNYFRL